MTKRKTTQAKPLELAAAATEEVRGGAEWKLTNVWVSSFEDDRTKRPAGAVDSYQKSTETVSN